MPVAARKRPALRRRPALRPAPTRRPASPRLPRPPSVSPPFSDRLNRLRATLARQSLGWFLVTNPLDVGYLTGFLGGDSYLLVGPQGATIISDFRYQEELESVEPLVRVYIRKGGMLAAVAEVFTAQRVDRCGYQSEFVTVADRAAFAQVLGESGSDRLSPTTGILAAMREIKDDSEVACIRYAARIQETALLAILPSIRPGVTELEIAARLEGEMKTRGSSEPGFQTIVAAKANGSLPHYRPRAVKLAANQPVLIDWGAVFRGYHSDMTRTFSLGRWPPKVREIYGIVLEAQEAAAAALAPGKTTREIDSVARAIIADAGYGERFGHGLGHGLGFNGHEDPRLSHMTADAPLRVGQVVTVEPGIYLPGVGGVRIEDDYLITPSGGICLCTLPKGLAWSTL